MRRCVQTLIHQWRRTGIRVLYLALLTLAVATIAFCVFIAPKSTTKPALRTSIRNLMPLEVPGRNAAAHLERGMVELTRAERDLLEHLFLALHSVDTSPYCRSRATVGGRCFCHLEPLFSNFWIDGSKEVCVDRLSDDCRVLSFGISNDFSFDLAMEQLGCTVHAFDPTMNRSSFQRSERVFFHDLGLGSEDGLTAGLRVATLDTALQLVGWQEGVIDYIKLDVEASEWTALLQAMQAGGRPLSRVRQLTVEFHLYQWRPVLEAEPRVWNISLEHTRDFYNVIRGLQHIGFTLIHTKPYKDCLRLDVGCLSFIYETLWFNEKAGTSHE